MVEWFDMVAKIGVFHALTLVASHCFKERDRINKKIIENKGGNDQNELQSELQKFETLYENIMSVYLSGAVDSESTSMINGLLEHKCLAGYQITQGLISASNDCTRRYFESSLVYEIMKAMELSNGHDLEQHRALVASLMENDKLPINHNPSLNEDIDQSTNNAKSTGQGQLLYNNMRARITNCSGVFACLKMKSECAGDEGIYNALELICGTHCTDQLYLTIKERLNQHIPESHLGRISSKLDRTRKDFSAGSKEFRKSIPENSIDIRNAIIDLLIQQGCDTVVKEIYTDVTSEIKLMDRNVSSNEGDVCDVPVPDNIVHEATCIKRITSEIKNGTNDKYETLIQQLAKPLVTNALADKRNWPNLISSAKDKACKSSKKRQEQLIALTECIYTTSQFVCGDKGNGAINKLDVQSFVDSNIYRQFRELFKDKSLPLARENRGVEQKKKEDCGYSNNAGIVANNMPLPRDDVLYCESTTDFVRSTDSFRMLEGDCVAKTKLEAYRVAPFIGSTSGTMISHVQVCVILSRYYHASHILQDAKEMLKYFRNLLALLVVELGGHGLHESVALVIEVIKDTLPLHLRNLLNMERLFGRKDNAECFAIAVNRTMQYAEVIAHRIRVNAEIRGAGEQSTVADRSDDTADNATYCTTVSNVLQVSGAIAQVSRVPVVFPC